MYFKTTILKIALLRTYLESAADSGKAPKNLCNPDLCTRTGMNQRIFNLSALKA
jgi:hypothetical protein